MNIKKILLIIILAIIIVVGSVLLLKNNHNNTEENGKIKIVATNFASYDFVRAIIGDAKNIELSYLLGPGKDSHSYDPTAQDLIKIQNSDLFIYIGGEMEKWAEEIISTLNTKDSKMICIADYADTIEEQKIDGAEVEEEEEKVNGAFDEHIWTSPSNAIKMINSLETIIEELDIENKEVYKQNAENYIKEIQEVDKQIKEIVDNKVRDRLIFADKMPMQYFINYYGLKVSAAFSGCSTETEPSASTIAYLINRIEEENIPVIFYIELNDGKIAKLIAEETKNDCEALQIQTLHNVSKKDFEDGQTWVSLMKKNIEVLKKALQ